LCKTWSSPLYLETTECSNGPTFSLLDGCFLHADSDRTAALRPELVNLNLGDREKRVWCTRSQVRILFGLDTYTLIYGSRPILLFSSPNYRPAVPCLGCNLLYHPIHRQGKGHWSVPTSHSCYILYNAMQWENGNTEAPPVWKNKQNSSPCMPLYKSNGHWGTQMLCFVPGIVWRCCSLCER